MRAALTRAVTALFACLLAACEQQDRQFHALSLDLVPVPGAYAETMVTTKMPVGEAPRNEEKQRDHCLKDGPDPVRQEVTEKFDGLCSGPPLKFADGRISGSRQCLWSSEATQRLTMQFHGSYDAKRIEMIVTATAPEGSVRWVRTLTRTGQCLSNGEAIADAIARNDWSIADNTHSAEPHATR